MALNRRHVGLATHVVLLAAISLASASCSSRVNTGDRLGEVSQGSTRSDSAPGATPGANISGERFNMAEEQEVTDGTLKAWRVAIAHDKNKAEMSAQEWKKTREADEKTAMKQLEDLAEAHPKASFINHMMGQVERHFGNYAEAAKHFEEAVAKNRREPLLTFKLAEARRATGETKKAEQYYRETLDMRPDFPEARIGLARCLLTSDKGSAEAKDLIEQVLKSDPQNKEALDLQRSAGKTAARNETH